MEMSGLTKIYTTIQLISKNEDEIVSSKHRYHKSLKTQTLTKKRMDEIM